MAGSFDLGDYIQVPERLARFYELYPDGRVSSSPPVVVEIQGESKGKAKAQTYIQVTTTVYRTPDDPAPCQASAWELFPGKTPYTEESEMMNAETSAVGRALWAVGIEAKRGAASQEDVRKARAAQEVPEVAPPPSPEEQALLDREEMIFQLCKDLKGLDGDEGPFITSLRDTVGGRKINEIKDWISADPDIAEDVVRTLIHAVKQRQGEAPAPETGPPPPASTKPKRTKRAAVGSAVSPEVEAATNVVKGAFPGAEEVAE